METGRTSWVWVLLASVLGISAGASAETITGVVHDSSDMSPVEAAIVTLQVTEFSTETAVDGTFALEVPAGSGLVVVAVKKGFFNGWVTVDAPSTGAVILLDPVPQDDDPNYVFIEPTTCGACHPDQLAEWTGSPMANAGFNTWVDDIYSGTGTPGGMGGFVYLRDSVFAGTNPNSECASCHQPEHWINNPFAALADPLQPPTPEVVHGISCEVCHKIADVNVANVNFPGIFPGSVTFTRPRGPMFPAVEYGTLPDANFEFSTLMRPSYQPQLVAEMCAACHQDAADPDENHSFAGVISEPTYLEWVVTPYADAGSPLYANCVDCHMLPSGNDTLCNVLSPPLIRDPASVRSHTILGTTPFYLENAVELFMQTAIVGGELSVDVAVANTLTGHHVPTGVTVRNMILLVEAWRDGDDPLINPLPHTGVQTIHDLGGVGDPASGYYAGLPGKFFAKVNHDANGVGPTFFTEATGIQFDNRIPALATDSSQYSFELPVEGGPVHVRARLIYRRAFRFLVDAKGWTEDGHGAPLEDVAPPHYGHLMEIAEDVISAPAIPGACCQPEGSCSLQADEAACLLIQDASWFGAGTLCADDDMNGVADLCDTGAAVPTVSHWGAFILILSLMAAAKVVFVQRRVE